MKNKNTNNCCSSSTIGNIPRCCCGLLESDCIFKNTGVCPDPKKTNWKA